MYLTYRSNEAPGGPTVRTTIVDLLPTEADPPLSVLFCGVNPGLSTVETGLHFHRPGNRFWRALHLAGFTPTVLAPEEQWQLPRAGLGITALVARATARADELSPAELVGNVPRLTDLLIRTRPAWLGFLGITAFRVAFRMPRGDRPSDPHACGHRRLGAPEPEWPEQALDRRGPR